MATLDSVSAREELNKVEGESHLVPMVWALQPWGATAMGSLAIGLSQPLVRQGGVQKTIGGQSDDILALGGLWAVAATLGVCLKPWCIA